MWPSFHPTQARRDRGGTHFLLVESMFVLVCLAGLPGTPRWAVDAAGLVLVWFLSGKKLSREKRGEASNMLELPGGSVQGGIRVHVVESARVGSEGIANS